MTYTIGDLVKVTITNLLVTDDIYGSTTAVRGVAAHAEYSERSKKKDNELYFNSNYGNIVIERVARDITLTPKVGDIYKADNKIWYVRKYKGMYGTIVIEDGLGNSYSDDSLNLNSEVKAFALKNPVLLVRDGKEVTSTW
jgi:hypothetical protein